MYTCIRCNEVVQSKDRQAHSASQTHQDNGGSATVDDADYEKSSGSDSTISPQGVSKIR